MKCKAYWLGVLLLGACGVTAGNPDKIGGKADHDPVSDQAVWIDKRYPAGAKAGEIIHLEGSQFGPKGRVLIGEQEASITEWSDNQVAFEMPATLETACTTARLEYMADDATASAAETTSASRRAMHSNSVSLVQGASGAWMPGDDLPMPRQAGVAVWSGKEFILWGGYWVNNGSRYNPSSDSWLRISQSGAPAASLKGVWTGKEMIVGDSNLSAYDPFSDTWRKLSTKGKPKVDPGTFYGGMIWTGEEVIVLWPGGIYNPETDTWRKLPAQRFFTKPQDGLDLLVWTGTEIIVWNGLPDGGARFNPETNVWVPMTRKGAPENGDTGVWSGTELLIPGQIGSPGAAYNPELDRWRPLPAVGEPRSNESGGRKAIWTGTEMLVWGDLPFRINPKTNVGAVWDIASLDRLDAVPGEYSLVWTGKNALVWGGRHGYRFDPKKNTWNVIHNGLVEPLRVYGQSAVWTGSEIIVWGGVREVGNARRDGARYDPVKNSWSAIEQAPEGRFAHTAVWAGSHMLVWGGDKGMMDYRYCASDYDPAYCDLWGSQPAASALAFDPVKNSWESIPFSPAAPTTTRGVTAVQAGTETFLWGGHNPGKSGNSGQVAPNGALYNHALKTWRSAATNPTLTTLNPVAAYVGGRVVLWSPSSYFDGSTWQRTSVGAVYDPSLNAWSPVTTAGAPKLGKAIGFSAGDQFLVWGTSLYNGLWEGSSQQTVTEGGFYNPASNQWTSIPWQGGIHQNGTIALHAVWTGTSLLAMGLGTPLDQAYPTRASLYTVSYDRENARWQQGGKSCYAVPYGGGFGDMLVWTGDQLIYWGPDVGLHLYRP